MSVHPKDSLKTLDLPLLLLCNLGSVQLTFELQVLIYEEVVSTIILEGCCEVDDMPFVKYLL